MTTPRMLGQGVRSMLRYKWRTAFMMLGSLLGVASLTFSVSLGESVRTKVLRTVQQIMGDGAVLVVGGGSRIMGSPRAGASRLTMDDINAALQEVPGVADWDPQADLGGVSARRAGAATTVRVLGASERWGRVWGRGVSRGTSFDAAAVAGAQRVALIGETVARTLFAGEDPVDSEVQVGAVSFRVIGVLEPFGVDMHGMDRDNEILVPISTLMRRLTNVDAISAAKLVLDDPSRAATTARALGAVLRRRHALDRDQPDDFMIVTPDQAQQMVKMVARVLGLYVPLVAGVVLIVGGIVAATLMLSSVNARVSEIGLRCAVGARPEDIRWQFIIETSVTILAGGAGGIVLGYLGVLVVARQAHVGGGLSWTAVVVGLLASGVTGLLASVVPARRAARLHPADALR